MERMGALDATFLAVEDAVNHMHIGSVGIFEGPPPSFEAFRDLVDSKLPLVPRYRQKVRTAPASIGRPVWIDDPNFRLEYHVRHTALPSPGGDEQLQRLVGRVMSQQLDRHKPLWEMWMIEGLNDGSWACITKVHHCMVDGVAGSDLIAVLLDLERSPSRTSSESEEVDWAPEPEPSTFDLARHSLTGLAAVPFTWARRVGGVLRNPRIVIGTVTDTVRGAGGLTPASGTPSDSSLFRPIGPHRRWLGAQASLDDIKRVKDAAGFTVNDVALAMATSGLRSLLDKRGELSAWSDVRSLVPVSMRAKDARGVLDNRVAALLADLPVSIDDPVERLSMIHERMLELKGSGEVEASEAVLDTTALMPPMLTALITRVLTHRQHTVHTVTTNVPGPPFPLYALGHRMLAAYPYVPIAGKMSVGIAMWSYIDALNFGLTTDADSPDDLDVLASGITTGLDELRDAFL